MASVFIQEIAQLVLDAQLAAVPPITSCWALKVNESDDHLDREVILYSTGGLAAIRVQEEKGAKYVQQLAQVRVRALDQLEAAERAQALWRQVFNGQVRNRYVLDTYYLGVDVEQPVYFLGRDDSDRYLFGFNIRALKEPS